MIYAVIDTNVLVSALITHNSLSATAKVVRLLLDGEFTPLYESSIIEEYQEVLHRDKFGFSDERIKTVLEVVRTGLCLGRTPSNEIFPDQDDAVFYEVALSKEGTFLVTGNFRHFPKSPIVVTPAEMISILEEKK